MKFIDKNRINSLPQTAGVYAFKDKGLLYIGKAGNIRNRVKNHFNQPNYKDEMFIDSVKKIGYEKTDSEIEALILESELIKARKPRYNTLWKDDKNYFYVALDNYVRLVHQPKKNDIGPFVDGQAIKKTMKVLRKIFPYYTQKKHPKGLCSWCHLSLCPGSDVKQYQKNIKNLRAVLRGKKNSVLKSLKKEMMTASKNQDFEKAKDLRDKITALEKVMTNAKIIEKEFDYPKTKQALKEVFQKDIERIEAYDISNIQGKQATGSMIVFIEGKPEKSLYRKFKIRIRGPNDTAMIKEVLKRRLTHKEWPLPDLMLIDGGKPQLSAAKEVVKKVMVVALAKKHNELFLTKKPLLLKNLKRAVSDLILQMRDEAHRFAITYHKKLREIDLKLNT